MIFRDYRLSRYFLESTRLFRGIINVPHRYFERSHCAFGQPVLLRSEFGGMRHFPSIHVTQFPPKIPGQTGPPASVIIRLGFPIVRTQSFTKVWPTCSAGRANNIDQLVNLESESIMNKARKFLFSFSSHKSLNGKMMPNAPTSPLYFDSRQATLGGAVL